MKKGFTLVELLAVIVILAVILVIAVPQINNVIKETRKNSLASTGKLIAAKAEEKEVENDALEKTESITCADLVKLDDNYGNCTVSKNSTTGKWEVTIVGANKFSGYTCTGTKDNMSCTERDTNTPEYVYTGLDFHLSSTIVITDSEKCMNEVPNLISGIGASTSEDIEDTIYNICHNSKDVDGDGSNHDTTYYFGLIMMFANLTEEDISAFARIDSEWIGAVDDYTKLDKSVFLRWPGATINFDKNDKKEVCTLSFGNLTCFDIASNGYEETLNLMKQLVGESNCRVSGSYNDNQMIKCSIANQEYCEITGGNAGWVACVSGSTSCSVYVDGSSKCVNTEM